MAVVANVNRGKGQRALTAEDFLPAAHSDGETALALFDAMFTDRINRKLAN